MGLAEHTNSVRSLKFQPTQHIYSPHNMKQLAETKIDKKRKKKLRETRSNKHKKNQHNSLGNLHNCGRVQVDSSGFSLDTKSPSGFRSRISGSSGRSRSWSSRWMAFLLKATDGNMRELYYLVWSDNSSRKRQDKRTRPPRGSQTTQLQHIRNSHSDKRQ